jgi:beta-1,4-mannosyltransferase
MPIGNYDGVYPPGRSKAELLKEIGLSVDVPLLLCVGQIRPHKGIDIACEAAAELGQTASLLVAGHAPILSYYNRVKAMMEEIPNAVLLNKELTEQEFGEFVRASELVLLPYRSVTGSSAALAALTLRRGVIASDLPFFRSLLQGHERAGRLFAPGDARSLALAIKDFLKVPTAERDEAARRLSSSFDWAQVILPVARALRELVKRHTAQLIGLRELPTSNKAPSMSLSTSALPRLTS